MKMLKHMLFYPYTDTHLEVQPKTGYTFYLITLNKKRERKKKTIWVTSVSYAYQLHPT